MGRNRAISNALETWLDSIKKESLTENLAYPVVKNIFKKNVLTSY